MRLLTLEKKHLFLGKLIELRQQLKAFKPENTLQSLELFENQLTLDEMEACFFDSDPHKINANLMSLLSSRWGRVCNSSMCYTQQPYNLVNQLCLEIAKEIAPPVSTTSEIEALELNTGPYCLLMPSLENSVDVYGNNIHLLSLHEFVLSDNAQVFIPLAQCLHQASVSDGGQLRQIVAIDGRYPNLTPTEIMRVSQHSKQARELYQAVIALNKQRLLGNDIGAKLSKLVVALRSGGAHSARSYGSEFNAGSEANVGILAFHDYWVALSERQKLAIFTETPELQAILEDLFRPNDVNYKKDRFCVELIADELDPIIQKYNAKRTIQALHNRVLKQETVFETAIQNRNALAIISKEIPPKHILHHIFKLNTDAQKVLFKQQGYENALMYALAHESDALTDFELDEKSKQYAISVQVNANNDSALIVASKKGEANVIELLLSWGAQTESRDLNNCTALHWAAYNGHVDAVTCLLEHGALLEARGAGDNTTLNLALLRGKDAVVELLLKKNAKINARSIKGLNALDIAIAIYPKFVEPILMQLATLPAGEQAECLLNVPGGPYPNVLFYAAANKPALFDTLVTKVLQQPTQALTSAVCDASNIKGYTPLILAAQIGAHESLPKLLESGLKIESCDLNNDTALHWAAYNGHVDAVTCLLEHGALLEARGAGDNTTLNFAVLRGKGAVAKLLLKKNANVNARNIKGQNALDIAIAGYPKFVEPILMQLATLPAGEQAECLLNVPGGPYPNVLFYAAANKPALFDTLVTKVLQQPTQALTSAVCDASNIKGYTPLILAAQIGAHESLPKLLESGLKIESRDLNNDTALHWAAYNGHVDAVTCLLEHGALLEARGAGGNTTLNLALLRGKGAVVELLLKKNANVNARNIQGQNALDIAIARYPKFIEPILMQLATLPADEQAECLLSVPGGPYDDVYAYAAAEDPEFLNRLILSSLKESNASTDATIAILAKTHFDEHIEHISAHYQRMKEKSLSNSNYINAASAAKTLLIECGKAKVALFQSDAVADIKILSFKNACKSAIETATPVLEKHREWGKVLAEFLLAIITLPISLPLYAVGFFSPKTKSNQLLDKLHEAIDKPSSQGG